MGNEEGWDDDVAGEDKAPTIAKPEDTPVVQSAGKPHVAEKADPSSVQVRIKAGQKASSLKVHGLTITDEYTDVPNGKLALVTSAAATNGITLERP